MIDQWAQQSIVNEIATAAQRATAAFDEQLRPSVVFRPQLYQDGTQWCALFGDNIQVGLAVFGDSPDAAMRAFDAAWYGATTDQEPQG